MAEVELTVEEAAKRLARAPGVAVPWQEKVKELPPIVADEAMVRRVWEDVDGLAYMYIWQLLVSF